MGNCDFSKTVVKRFQNWFDVLKRCKRYAKKLNKIDNLLNKYEKEYLTSMDPVTKQLISDIDDILG